MNLKKIKTAFENPFDLRFVSGLMKLLILMWVAGWSEKFHG
jgi:hypothetical protein